MDSLLGKLASLAYEFYGVMLPGLVLVLFVLTWWFALGDLPALASHQVVPVFPAGLLLKLLDQVPAGRSIVIVGCLLVVFYLCGHALNWIWKARFRKGKTRRDRLKEFGAEWTERGFRVGRFLLAVPSRLESYDQALKPLFEAVSPRFVPLGERPDWRHFYPVAKIYLQRADGPSLLATYQNKYTLHRSIAAAGVVLFWLTSSSLVTAFYFRWSGWPENPHWRGLVALELISLVVVAGFSGTYAYNWRLWGDSVVTESYAAAFPPVIGERTSGGWE